MTGISKIVLAYFYSYVVDSLGGVGFFEVQLSVFCIPLLVFLLTNYSQDMSDSKQNVNLKVV